MSSYKTALKLVRVLLNEETILTEDLIREKVKFILNSFQDVDEEKMVRELKSDNVIWIGRGTTLDDWEDHLPWLDEYKSRISWDFWNRYVCYLEEEKGWSQPIVNSLDLLTDDIIERLENPNRNGEWDRRGMVVGQVQSGKTANYTGLVCKAVDAGYKLIIVLAGITDSLRSQTQIRLDEGFLGFDSKVSKAFDPNKNSFVGVGKIRTKKWLIAHSGTSSDQKGDFTRAGSKQFAIVPGGDPIILVVKKQKNILENLLNWGLHVRGIKDTELNRQIVREVPLLIIDDEADNASIDTNPLAVDEDGNIVDNHDPTKINALIRKLLYSFEQSSYVGYTATPFANIFISSSIANPECGEDLFPRSFIISLPTPSNYIGPSEVFGLDADPNISLDEVKNLPLIRSIDEEKEWVPIKHKKHLVPGEIPLSLKEAIKAFILSCTIRIVRGQAREHNSMLIHVTLFTDVQDKVATQVQHELRSLQRRLKYGDENTMASLLDEFEKLWKEDFTPTTESMANSHPQLVPWEEIKDLSWDMLRNLLYEAASKIKVKKINGTAKDILDYEEHKKQGLGLHVIAVGGNKLSRGLTLEGLTVSYYLRTSKMYDTLMQMGRWFGYRPGYLDLCRLYTTDDLVERYEHIATASEELRQEFNRMEDEGAKPVDFGLKVRTHPDRLMIVTATNKMRTGTTIKFSYARSLSETTVFYKNEAVNSNNFDATEKLLNFLGKIDEAETSNNYVWKQVTADRIVEFLSAYKSHEKCPAANTGLLITYIQQLLQEHELTSWTVVLLSQKGARTRFSIAGKDIGLTRRTNVSKLSQEYKVSKSHILSPLDEWLDLSLEMRQVIIEESNAHRLAKGKEVDSRPSPPVLRSKRSPQNGLLLLYPLDPTDIVSYETPIVGFVISFPNSKLKREVEYIANTTFMEQLDQL
jgi:Z1 domain